MSRNTKYGPILSNNVYRKSYFFRKNKIRISFCSGTGSLSVKEEAEEAATVVLVGSYLVGPTSPYKG